MFMLGTIALSYHLNDKVNIDLFPQDSLVLKDDIVPNEQRKPRAWMKNSGVNYFFFSSPVLGKKIIKVGSQISLSLLPLRLSEDLFISVSLPFLTLL